jgi:hypothetical protein
MREVVLAAGTPARFGDLVTIDASGPSTYPVLAATNQGVVAAWTAGGERPAVGVRLLDVPARP